MTALRTFGSMPDHVKTGPIALSNYNYRAEAHCALKSDRKGNHPVIRHGSSEFWMWYEYFDCWLHGRPLAFKMLLENEGREITVPEAEPQWFDSSFVPTRGWRK